MTTRSSRNDDDYDEEEEEERKKNIEKPQKFQQIIRNYFLFVTFSSVIIMKFDKLNCGAE
jgi:hypothetical protein